MNLLHSGREACRSFEPLLEDYLENRLDIVARTRVEAHLARCQRCRRAHESAQAAAALFALVHWEAPQPGPFFAENVRAAILRALRLRDNWEAQWQPVAQLASRVCLAAGALAFLLGLLLAGNFRGYPPASPAPERPALRALVGDAGPPGVVQDELQLLVASDERSR
jgi:predicted anti-sigma-YlaC factor YlaD